jgi:hypothetical protein
MYRPQPEVGTRLAKQLKKLGIALAFLECEGTVNERVYSILVRVALDTCVGFNLDIVQALALEKELTIMEISHFTDIPVTTLRQRLDDMELLNVINSAREMNTAGRGAPMLRYTLSERILKFWDAAGLSGEYAPNSIVKIKVGRKRRAHRAEHKPQRKPV